MDSKNVNFSNMTASEIYRCACKIFTSGDVGNGEKGIILAAEKGCPQAMRHLACMYEKGNCVKQDKEEAFKWYKLAAASGEFDEAFADEVPPIVHRMLGEMYKNGWGIEQNLEEAEKLFKAANTYDE